MPFILVHPLLRPQFTDVLSTHCWNMPHQYGIYIHLVTLESLKQFSAEQPDGSVAVVGMPHDSVGLGHLILALTS